MNVTKRLKPSDANVGGHLADVVDDGGEEVGGRHRSRGGKDWPPIVSKKLSSFMGIRMRLASRVLHNLKLEPLTAFAPQGPEAQQLVNVLLPVHKLLWVEIAELNH